MFPSNVESPGRREKQLHLKFAAREAAWKEQPAILRNSHTIFNADSTTISDIAAVPPVHLVVTSPPYWNLKKYEDAEGQLGHVDDLEEFLGLLDKVWQGCFEKLVPGGRLCIVVGDVCRSRKAHGRHLVEPLHAHISIRCQRLGFDPLAPIIWNKISNMKTEVNGNGAGFLGKPYEPNAIVKNDIEFILLLRKPGGYRHPTEQQRDLSILNKDDYKKWFTQIWSDVPGDIQREHPAPYPSQLAKRLIGMFSFVGDTVLDPFWGLGNTTLAAMEMHRSSVGFELVPEYIEKARKRFEDIPELSTIDFIGAPIA